MTNDGTSGMPATLPRRALGLDLGEARVGVAVSDDLGLFAHPRETIHLPAQTPGRDQAILARVLEVVAREQIAVVVIGLPRNMNGTEGPASAKSRAFADLVRARSACEVRLIDERLTTVAAQRALHETGKNVKNSRAVIDQVAAQMILQVYLDGEQMKSGCSGGLWPSNAPAGHNAADNHRSLSDLADRPSGSADSPPL